MFSGWYINVKPIIIGLQLLSLVQWIKQLRGDLGHCSEMVILHVDNTGALTDRLTRSLSLGHIDVMQHIVRELVLSKRLQVQYVHTTLQLADIYTKPQAADSY